MNPYIEHLDLEDSNIPIRALFGDSNNLYLGHPTHIHGAIEVVYLLEGEMDFYIEGERIRLKKDQIIIINGLIVHSSKMSQDIHTKICILQFELDLLYGEVLKQKKYLINFVNSSVEKYKVIDINANRENKFISKILLEIAHEYVNKDKAYDLIILADIFRFIAFLYRYEIIKSIPETLNQVENNQITRIASVFDYVEKHYSDAIRVEDVANILNLEYTYFCRLFKKITGRTFLTYLNYYRVAVAKEKLLKPGVSIADIILDTGFTSHSYFSRTFKRFTGFSPSEYKDKFSIKG